MADLNRELEELAELTQRVNEEMRLYGQITAQTREALKDAEMKEKYGIENYTKVTENAAVAVKALGRSVTEGVAAMYNNKKGAAAFNSSLDQLSTAAMAAGTAMMLLGGPVGVVAGAATMAAAGLMKLFGVANEQSDAVFKGFQELSKSGAAASDGMEGVFRGAQRVGLGFQELDAYTRIISESSKDLALFRGSVYEGRRSLEDINIAMFDQVDSLYAMGLSQEQIVEGSAAYLRLQSRIGLTQNKTANELAESTRKYLVEQDALTKLTGMTRKEQEDAREEIRSQERFAAVTAEMRAKGQVAQANELEKTYLILRSRSKDAAQGFADLTTGMVTTEAAQKATLATQGDAMRQGQRLKAGQASAVEAAQSIAKAYGLTAKQFNQLAQAGVFNSTFGDFVGALELGIMKQNDLVKLADEIQEDQKKAGILGGKAIDAETQKQIDLRKKQLLQTLGLQNNMNDVSKASTAAMGLFTSAIEVATDAIDWMVSKIPGFTPKTREEMAANRAVAVAEDEVKQLEVKVANARSKQDKEVFEKQLAAAKKQLLNAEVDAQYAKDRAAGKTSNTVGGNQVRADGSIINPGDEDYVATVAPKRATRSPAESVPLSQESTSRSGGASTTSSATATPRPNNPIKDVVQIGPGFNVVERPGGAEEKQVGARNWRNNNPGNIEQGPFAQARGSIGGDPRFAIFPDYQTGKKAKADLIFEGKNYKDLDLKSAIERYAPSFENDVRAYQNVVLRAVNGQNKRMSEYSQAERDAILAAMERHEGFKPGKIIPMADGGIIKARPGGTLVQAAEAGVNEAFIPLRNGAVPVSFDSSLLIKKLSAGISENTATDMAQKMLQNTTMQNLNQALAKVQTPAVLTVDDQLKTQLSELLGSVRSELGDVVRQVGSEFRSAMDQAIRNMPRGTDNALAAEQLTLLSALVSEQKTANDISKKILYSQS